MATLMVYVGSMPLRGPPGPAQWAFSTADRFLPTSISPLQHFYTILEPIHSTDAASSAMELTVFDFQPRNPEDLYTAITALSGGKIPGVVLKRKMSRLPTRRFWRVGPAKTGIDMDAAVKFNMDWDNELQLWKNDCRDHTNALVEFLTGEQDILQKLFSG